MKTILGKLGRKRTIIFWPENILLITGQSLGFPTEETRSELDLRFRSEIVDNFIKQEVRPPWEMISELQSSGGDQTPRLTLTTRSSGEVTTG